jgi:glycosyltransferase involved in cell wall biosynthesis
MLCPSRNETFSQAVVQGMLTALPVIASPLPVFTEKLDTGAGVVCRTTEDFTNAMADLARHPEKRRRMGAIGRQTALERYAWDTDRFLDRYLFPAQGFGDA